MPKKEKPPPSVAPLKRTTGGNARCDQAWIEEMLEDGSLHEVAPEDRPPGFFYDVIYQWDYPADEINPDFFEEFRPTQGFSKENPKRCTGTSYVRDQRGGYVVDDEWNRITRHCLGKPGSGTVVCRVHGSQIPQVKAAAVRRLAEAAEIVALRLVGLTGPVDEENNRVEHRDRISASNSVLDRVGIKGGVEVEVTVPGFKRVLEKMFGDDSDDE